MMCCCVAIEEPIITQIINPNTKRFPSSPPPRQALPTLAVALSLLPFAWKLLDKCCPYLLVGLYWIEPNGIFSKQQFHIAQKLIILHLLLHVLDIISTFSRNG